MVEDIQVATKPGKNGEARHWNRNFSPLEIGKTWFANELTTIAPITLRRDTAELRERYGLVKTNKKSAEVFESHCVDSWVLANVWTGGHATPDLTRLLRVTPLRFHRRQLHALQPATGGMRRPYGSTRSLGYKRGSLVTHPKWGTAYVGGYLNDRISLHSPVNGKRLCQNAKPSECKFLAFASWRARLLPVAYYRVSAAYKG